MNQKLVVIILATVVLLSGCSGGTSAGTGTSDGVQDGTTTPESATAGDHPAVKNGTLDVSRLVQRHLASLRGANSFTVLNNRTITYVENGSVAGRSTLSNKADIANQRQRLENRLYTPDGTIQSELIRFGNATTICTAQNGEYECSDGGISIQRMIGSTMETTSLETIGAPDFRPDGIADREEQSLYRYSASTFRSSLDSDTESELYGANPTLMEATLLVHPDGRIVEYSLIYQTDGETPRELDLTYLTSAINATTFEPLAPSE